MGRIAWVTAPLLFFGGCTDSVDYEPASKGLEDFVSRQPIGDAPDAWIEMKNAMGEWEKTGLIFGYYGDNDECLKAIADLKATNYAREYRCRPANVKKP